MNKDLETPFRDGVDGQVVVCAHCGRNKDTSDYTESNSSANMWHKCSCPGHLDTLVIGLDEIPNLAEVVDQFETYLEHEPCTHPTNSCWIHSVISNMCPSCRLRHVFIHLIRFQQQSRWIDPGMPH